MNKGARFILGILVFLAAAVFSLFGETKARRLLIIDSQTSDPYVSVRVAMIEWLAQLGYSEAAGTLVTKTYSMGNSPDFIRRIEFEEGSALASWDLIVPNGTIATMAAWSAWKHTDLRFVFVAVTDPVGLGVLDSLKTPPKANFTGVTYPVPVEDRLRFLMAAMPNARRIGYVWGDMPQSVSYNHWLDTALKGSEFSGLSLVSRKIDFVSGEFGTRRMILEAAAEAARINDEVDVFLVPNDQMGVDPEYTRRLHAAVTKPVLGLTREQVESRDCASFAIYPVSASMGIRGADLIARYFAGEPFASLLPKSASVDTVFSPEAVKRFGLKITPEFKKKTP